MTKNEPVISQVLTEQNQGHKSRVQIFKQLEKLLGRPVVSFFTSFNYRVMLENKDADMLEGVLQKVDTSRGLALVINSPGGDGLAAERIINIGRSYSGTGEYYVLVPGKAKSAATIVCFGASKIYMGPISELGPIDPQITIPDSGRVKRFSLCNIVDSYKALFTEAVKTKGNLQPYLQQLANYDAREIKEFEDAISLSEDVAIKALRGGMMNSKTDVEIKKKIAPFLTPKTTKAHGRAICI
jgi:ClpP class serine protease